MITSTKNHAPLANAGGAYLNKTNHATMKYQLLITANCDSDSVVIFAQEYDKNIISDGRIKEVISSLIPCVKWEYDDGDDVVGTNYCQYAAYTESDDYTHYLLASWNAIDETKGCRLF